jgi:hypothetical protein
MGHERSFTHIAFIQGDFDAGYLYECEFLEEEEKKKKPANELYEPTRTVSIHDSADMPISCIKFRYYDCGDFV